MLTPFGILLPQDLQDCGRHILDPLPARRWPALGGATAGLMALILAGCAGGLTGSAAQVPCPAAIDTPVLYPGDTWFYRHEDGQRSAQSYDKVTEDGLLRSRGPKRGAEYYHDHAHTLRKVYSQGTWLTAETPAFPEIGKPELDFPLTVGKTWVNRHYTNAGVPINAGYQIVGCEEVTVPAGTFRTVRIEVSAVYTHTPGAASLEYTLWYAPAVKFWVKRAGGRATFWTPVSGYELESFTIDDPEPPRPKVP